MKPKHIKKLLMAEINKVSNNPKSYCFNPNSSFTRNRKISMKKAMTGIIGMGSGSLTNELIDKFFELRSHKGLTYEEAKNIIENDYLYVQNTDTNTATNYQEILNIFLNTQRFLRLHPKIFVNY